MVKRIAIGLLVASLLLLMVYGLDVVVASTGAAQADPSERRGFLPFDESVRGAGFGGSAVIMSIIAFAISRKLYAPAVSVLLFVNGGLIIAGMLMLVAQGALASENSSGAMRTIASTLAMGAILVGLGGWKVALDRKKVLTEGREPPQR